jgi:hypothetical protein
LQRGPSERKEHHEQDYHSVLPTRYQKDIQIKEIPAFARILLSSPAGDNSPPTISIPIIAEHEANNINFRRPTWSIMADPVRAPIMDVTELTRFNSRCRFVSVIPARPRRAGRKSAVNATRYMGKIPTE